MIDPCHWLLGVGSRGEAKVKNFECKVRQAQQVKKGRNMNEAERGKESMV